MNVAEHYRWRQSDHGHPRLKLLASRFRNHHRPNFLAAM
jgi:hypothetical protein